MGALLGTQNGREVEIVNTFELAAAEDTSGTESANVIVDREFLTSRTLQCEARLGSLCVTVLIFLKINKYFLRWSSLDGIRSPLSLPRYI